MSATAEHSYAFAPFMRSRPYARRQLTYARWIGRRHPFRHVRPLTLAAGIVVWIAGTRAVVAVSEFPRQSLLEGQFHGCPTFKQSSHC